MFLNVGPRGDLCFGRLVTRAKTGLTKFLETKHKPTSVLITIRRTRGRDNPIASLFSGLNGQSAHDATQRVEATIDNRVRAFKGVPVPTLPVAILKEDASGRRSDTWDVQTHNGDDLYSYNYTTGHDLLNSGRQAVEKLNR